MTFGKDFNAEQRAAFDAMSAERNLGMERTYGDINANSVASDYANFKGTGVQTDGVKPNPLYNIPEQSYGNTPNSVASDYANFKGTGVQTGRMDSSLLNQDRSVGNVDGTDYYNAIRDEAIKPNNILNGYLGIQEIPNLMANGSSTRGSRGNRYNATPLTDQEFNTGKNKFIDMLTPNNYGLTSNEASFKAFDDSGEYKISPLFSQGRNISSNMMSNGSNNGRGIDTSSSSTLGRDVASGMNDNLNNVMRMTENIQSKYGDPNDKTIDQIMAEYNVNNAENAFQGMDNNRGLMQTVGDAFVPDFYQKGSGFTNNLNRAFGGADVTNSQIYNHLNVNKPYNNQTILNNAISDATDGYHIRSGKDYGSMTKGNLPLGGLPATLGAMAYQQLDGIADSSLLDGVMGRGKANLSDVGGTFGYNAFLQSMDNIEGLRQSGNAPFLNKAHTLGQNIHGLLNRPPSEDAIRIAKQKEAGTFQPGKKSFAYEPVKPVVVTPKQTVADRKGYTPKPVAVVKPKVKVNYNKNKPVAVKKTKPTPRGPAPVKVTRTTGSRGGRGNVAAKKSVAKKSTPSKSYSSYSRRVGGR